MQADISAADLGGATIMGSIIGRCPSQPLIEYLKTRGQQWRQDRYAGMPVVGRQSRTDYELQFRLANKLR